MTITIPIEVLMFAGFIAGWCIFFSALRFACAGAFNLDTDTLFLMGVFSGVLSAVLVKNFGFPHLIPIAAMSAILVLSIAPPLIIVRGILKKEQAETRAT